MLEQADAWQGELADYADDDYASKAGYHNEIVSSEDDDDAGAALRGGPQRIGAAAGPAGLLRARQGTMGNDSFIEGFVRGPMDREHDLSQLHGLSESSAPGPRRGNIQHTFAQDCSLWYGAPRADRASAGVTEGSAAVEAPSDAQLKGRIDMIAAMVARGGDAMLDFAKRTHHGAHHRDSSVTLDVLPEFVCALAPLASSVQMYEPVFATQLSCSHYETRAVNVPHEFQDLQPKVSCSGTPAQATTSTIFLMGGSAPLSFTAASPTSAPPLPAWALSCSSVHSRAITRRRVAAQTR